MIAISGTVKVLTFDFDIFTCHLLLFCVASGTMQMRLKPLGREVGHLVGCKRPSSYNNTFHPGQKHKYCAIFVPSHYSLARALARDNRRCVY
jgi:hypothetical protein